MKTLVTRRDFLRYSGLGVAGMVAGPLILPRSLFGANAPSNKIHIGLIGLGRQAMYANLLPFLQSPDCVVTAVCDVDAWRLQRAVKKVDKFYGKSGCKGYHDFRELLADPGIDAVMISTPDHWHAPMAIAAVKAGKDVALEKPITRYVNEGRILARAAAQHKRIFRVDSEFRSLAPYHKAVELVRNGRIGKVHTVRIGTPTEEFPREKAVVAPPPTDLDYDLWLGPAPQVEYMQKRVHPQHDFSRPGWMRNLDYCDGMITNWGAHMCDIAQWGAGTDLTGPVEISAVGKYHDDKVWNVLESFESSCKFANGIEMHYSMGQHHVRFEGEKGWIQVSEKSRLEASERTLLTEKLAPDAIRFPLRPEKEDFILSVKSRAPTMEDIEVGQRTTSFCHLAHIAIKLGGVKLAWDPDRETFPGNEAANKLLVRPPLRAPWTLE